MQAKEAAERTNPALELLRVFNRTISHYHLYTITALIILDVLFTAPEAALVGLSSVTFGLALTPSIIMFGFADVGLMALGFALTIALEKLMGKSVRDALPLAIMSAMFLAIPGPVFTLSVAAGKVLGKAFPEKKKPELLK